MKKLISLGICALLAFSGFAQSRPDWASVADPEIKSVGLSENNPNEISVVFNAPTDNKTADKGYVEMQGPYGKPVKNTFGKARKAEKHSEFVPEYSGKYSFTVYTQRNGESKAKASKTVDFNFSLPLAKPVVNILNIGGGTLSLKWDPVVEAEQYVISYTDSKGKTVELPGANALEGQIKGLKAGDYSDIIVYAVRGKERSASSTR